MKKEEKRRWRRKVRLLIVDDSKAVRERLVEMCSLNPHIKVVGQVSDGVEALLSIRAHRPDFVILDILMPRMNGIEVLAVMKKEDIKCTTLILSTAADETYQTKCFQLGASYVLNKLMDFEKLAVILGSLR